MSIYLYGIRKCAKTPVTLPDGTTVFVSHKLEFKTGHATSTHKSDASRVQRLIDRAKTTYGATFNGLVFSGDPERGAEVIAWKGAPFWFDCDKYAGETVGFLLKKPGGWTVAEAVDSIALRALPTDPQTSKGLFGTEWIPMVRMVVPQGFTPTSREVLSRTTLRA